MKKDTSERIRREKKQGEAKEWQGNGKGGTGKIKHCCEMKGHTGGRHLGVLKSLWSLINEYRRFGKTCSPYILYLCDNFEYKDSILIQMLRIYLQTFTVSDVVTINVYDRRRRTLGVRSVILS